MNYWLLNKINFNPSKLFIKMRCLQADLIFTGRGEFLRDHELLIEDDGTILSIQHRRNNLKIIPEKYMGILCPGFVNAHCHLELSYLKGIIPEETGMVGFISSLMNERNKFSLEQRLNTIEIAEIEMLKEGIVAVGDISNTTETSLLKKRNNCYYHTFVEIIGIRPIEAGERFIKSKDIIAEFDNATVVPHAPYTVSPGLLRMIGNQGNIEGKPISVHLNESREERQFISEGNGPFTDFFFKLGIEFPGSHLKTCTAIEYVLNDLKTSFPVQLVHNTYADQKDIDFARKTGMDLYWCLCPKANLYIEKNMPDIELFRKNNLKITIGTDSLASNDRLSILEEIKTILRYFPNIPLNEILEWATANGSELLGIDNRLGFFKPGRKPGILLIETETGGNLSLKQVKRII